MGGGYGTVPWDTVLVHFTAGYSYSYGRGVDDLKLEAEAGPSERWKLARSSEYCISSSSCAIVGTTHMLFKAGHLYQQP